MKPIQIGGLVSFTTIDYPGKLASVVFLVGCPLRCAYCSNPHLLTPHDGEYDPDRVEEWLQSRVGKLEAVVFSGGEALMQGDAVIEYMQRIRKLGFKIGLHTNGFYPETLKKAADTIDWIGLDFKATQNKYTDLTGQSIAYKNMIKSLEFWCGTGKDFEVRITCDPRYINKSDLLEIVDILKTYQVKNVAIQKYIPHFETPDTKTDSVSREQFFNDAELRNKINSMFSSVTWRE